MVWILLLVLVRFVVLLIRVCLCVSLRLRLGYCCVVIVFRLVNVLRFECGFG